MRGRLRRAGGVGLERLSDHPLKAAGAIAVLTGTAVMVVSALGTTGTPVTNAGEARVALSALAVFAVERPAYPVAVLAGIAVLLRKS